MYRTIIGRQAGRRAYECQDMNSYNHAANCVMTLPSEGIKLDSLALMIMMDIVPPQGHDDDDEMDGWGLIIILSSSSPIVRPGYNFQFLGTFL